MGITQIIDPFYKRLDPNSYRKTFEHGQLAWVPTAYAAGLPMIMEVDRQSPEDHFASVFRVRPMTDKDFRKRPKLPIKLLNLGETEELVVSRCKLRPAIILLTSPARFPDLLEELKRTGKAHLAHESVAVIPLYSVQKEDSDTGFPPVMIARIKALMYQQFFICPKKGSGLQWDSIGRLDRMFFARPIFPCVQPMPYALSDDGLLILTSMLRILFGLGTSQAEEETFLAIRELAMETLPERAR
jgi:hypothetical protein